MTNQSLIIFSSITGVVVVLIMYLIARGKTNIVIEEDYDTLEKVESAIKEELTVIVKDDDTLNLSDAEFNALFARKNKIRTALVDCVHGIEKAKIIVIEIMKDFIVEKVDSKKVSELLGLVEGMIPTDEVMFEIILYRYKRQHDKDALSKLIKKYGWEKERASTNAVTSKDKSYYVTSYDLHNAYREEDITLTEEERAYILAIVIYQRFKGFGVIDTIREMNINGINIGVSGSIMSNNSGNKDKASRAPNSVWVYFEGRYIHLRFLSFGTEQEIQRVVTMVSRYNSPGALTAKRGYIVNTAPDKSRILAIRPPASEYWAAFIRKFTLSDPSPNALIIKEQTKRGDLPIRLMMYLIKGEMTSAYTGRQGSGKTTMMASTMRYINPKYNIRVLEMAPELYLRELYNYQNVLSVQETTHTSSTELQDALKKTDGAVSVAGEVATNEVASRMVQLAMTASQFTLFSHHATTTEKLVYTLRNSLVASGDFADGKSAEEQVLQVVKFDIHLDYTPEGERFIERITEIIPLDEKKEYPEYDEEDMQNSMNKITIEYYERRTDRKSFVTNEILRYNKETHSYEAVNRISPETESLMRNNLGVHREDYDKFMFSNWGRRRASELHKDEVTKAVMDKYNEADIDIDILKEKPALKEKVSIETIEQRKKREKEEGKTTRKGKLVIASNGVATNVTENVVDKEVTSEPIEVEEVQNLISFDSIEETDKDEIIKEVINQEDKEVEREHSKPSDTISDDRDLITEISADELDFSFFTGKGEV